MTLDTETTIEFPTIAKFSEFYDRWSTSLVNALNGGFPRADREDAVQHAFVKVMFVKDSDGYKRVPRTERDWYGCLLWQARSYLSHSTDSRKAWDGHHKRAYDEGYMTSGTGAFCTLDDEVESKSAWETLYVICKEANMKDANVAACVRWWLNDEPSDLVEREMKEAEREMAETAKEANRNVRSWIHDSRTILDSDEYSPRLKACAGELLQFAVVVDHMQNDCATGSEIEAAGGIPGVFISLSHALDEARAACEDEDVCL